MLANRYMQLAEKPISDADFYGDDVRYSAEFECIENELNKAGSLHDKQGPDWAEVRDGCEALLQTQSKDLRAAVWLTWSLYQVDSMSGLEAGLGALNYLCAHHWQALHPRKPRTRLAAFNWLVPRIEQAFANLLPGETPQDTLQQLTKQLRELDDCMANHFADQAPLLMPVCRRLEALCREPESQPTPPDSAPDQTAATSAQIIPIKNPGNEISEAVNDSRDAHKCLRTIQDQARLLSNWWLQEMATDPRSFRLARTLLWLPIDALPEHDAQHTTTLRGLPADRLKNYRERLAQGQFSALLLDLETSLSRSPFWLDGQYMSWRCLQAMDATPAMYEVEIQLAMLLKRLPGLEQLCFHDQTAFADSDTRSWINQHVLPHIATPSSRAEGQANLISSAEQPWEEVLASASEQLRKGSLKAGIQMIRQAIPNLAGERERFNWQLAQARLCFQAREHDLARHQLESLYQVLHGSALERWEPDLALRVLQLLLACYDKLPGSAGLRERKNEIYQRLCHLNLEAALDQACGP